MAATKWLVCKCSSLKGHINRPRQQFPEKIFKNANSALFLCCLQPRERLHFYSSVLRAKLFAVLPCILPFLLFIHLQIFIEPLSGAKSSPGSGDKTKNEVHKVTVLMELTYWWAEWRQRANEQVDVLCMWRKQSYEGQSRSWRRESWEWSAMASLTLEQRSE